MAQHDNLERVTGERQAVDHVPDYEFVIAVFAGRAQVRDADVYAGKADTRHPRAIRSKPSLSTGDIEQAYGSVSGMQGCECCDSERL